MPYRVKILDDKKQVMAARTVHTELDVIDFIKKYQKASAALVTDSRMPDVEEYYCTDCGGPEHFENDHHPDCGYWTYKGGGDGPCDPEGICPVRIYFICPLMTEGRYVVDQEKTNDRNQS
jgi:hypothetical protein